MHTKKGPYRHSQYKKNIKSFPLRLQYQNSKLVCSTIFNLQFMSDPQSRNKLRTVFMKFQSISIDSTVFFS